MRLIKIIIIVTIVFVLACGVTELDKGKLLGRVKYHSSGDLMEGAKVILRQKQNDDFTIYDTLYTSSTGYFKFYDVESGIYDIHAVKYSDELEENISYVTPFISEFEFDDQVISPSVGDIEAYLMTSVNASISGTILYEDGSAAEGASVEVRFIQAGIEYIFNIVTCGTDGSFSCADFITGNYYLIINSVGVVPPVSKTTSMFFHDGNGELELGDIYLN